MRLARDHAQEMWPYFESAVKNIVDKFNHARSIDGLGFSFSDLGVGDFKLPFHNIFMRNGKRLSLIFGPLKKFARVSVKAAEYDDEIDRGEKKHDFSGRRLIGIDYVLDWLRCTIATEDPYNLFLFFLLLQNTSDVFQIQRVKNKFFNSELPPHIQTNVLMNVLLLYPKDENAFKASCLRGEFDAEWARKPIVSVEIQLTLSDFFIIKELEHDFYNVLRSTEPESFLLSNPLFVDDVMRPKVPWVLRKNPLDDTEIDAPKESAERAASKVKAKMDGAKELDAAINGDDPK